MIKRTLQQLSKSLSIMNLISVVLLLPIFIKCLQTTTILSKAFGGFSMQLEKLDRKNVSFLENHALRLDYSGLGINVIKTSQKDAFDIGFFINDQSEGRDIKMGELTIPMFIGVKYATAITMAFTIMSALAFKALTMAKMAATMAAVTFLTSLMSKKQQTLSPTYIEIDEPPHEDHHYPEYFSTGDYGPTGNTGTFYTYRQVPNEPVLSENSINYPIIGNSINNTPIIGNQQVAVVPVSRRRDTGKGRAKLPIFTIHRYDVES